MTNLDRSDYTPFMDGVKEIFSQKMKAAKASRINGWSARTLFKEITEEQSLTPAEQDIAWGILIVDILGYDDNKIKEMEDVWQNERKKAISQGTAPHVIKNVRRSSYSLFKSNEVDST
jgi:hypothetical protein